MMLKRKYLLSQYEVLPGVKDTKIIPIDDIYVLEVLP